MSPPPAPRDDRHAVVSGVVRRAWPSLAVLALLALAAAAPAPERARPAPPSQAAATCDPFSQNGTGGSTVVIDDFAGIRQPLPEGIAVASCSLRVQANGWTYSNVRLVEWDPLTLAPDASTAALRAAFCDPSDMSYYTINAVPRQVFVPPVVTRSAAGVAEAPRTTMALEVGQSNGTYPYYLQGYYEPEGDPAMPGATMFGPPGSHSELTGSHPVAAYALCDGGGTLDELRVVQAVRRTDALAPAPSAELVQRFTVPEPVDLRWVELAVDQLPAAVAAMAPGEENSMQMPPVAPVTVGIVDATELGDPPAVMPPALVEAVFLTFFYKQPGPRWAAPLDFDHTIRLTPGREYWLYLRTAGAYQFLSRALTGSEDANFTSSIGAFHARTNAADPWAPVPSQALAFKIIGTPTAPLTSPPAAGFRLRVAPNPARDVAEVTWSGAVGPVKLEVFDARGRRVAAGEGGAAGVWRVGARGAGARPLPAGVYFVHAHDSEGARPVERLVIVR